MLSQCPGRCGPNQRFQIVDSRLQSRQIPRIRTVSQNDRSVSQQPPTLGPPQRRLSKSLTELSNPDYLTFDSNAVQASWEAGEIAMAHLWGSRGTGLLDNEGSTEEIVSNTLLVSSPTVGGGDIPASTLWWDGFAIASNISDEDAEASFLAMLNGISPAVVKANNDAAVWLVEGYEPSPASAGVFATAAGKTKPYPMIPFMGLMHTALGAELTEFLQGSESAEQALADTEAAYISAAKEKGFLN